MRNCLLKTCCLAAMLCLLLNAEAQTGNTVFGNQAGFNLGTFSLDNTIIEAGAGFVNTIASNTTTIGQDALFDFSGGEGFNAHHNTGNHFLIRRTNRSIGKRTDSNRCCTPIRFFEII